jgi:hypothetical protein
MQTTLKIIIIAQNVEIILLYQLNFISISPSSKCNIYLTSIQDITNK